MTNTSTTKTKRISDKSEVELEYLEIKGEEFYKISNSDAMRPFFMSIVSDSNHWMFISSNGGLTAGRKNAQYALFPYYTDDKITESAEVTGSKTIVRVAQSDQTFLWEPFSAKSSELYRTSRNLYKNVYGNKVMFEEINHDLELTCRYQWCSSDRFGFVRNSTLVNNSDGEIKLSLVDGLQNILPYGVESDTQTRASNLVDAYKRSELVKEVGVGIYALSAIIVDKAEPSEALKANVVWSLGLPNPKHLLSSLQLKNFKQDEAIEEETDIKAEKGAYLIHAELSLAAKATSQWMMVADVNQDHADIVQLVESIKQDDELQQQVEQDIELGTQRLVGLCAASDGLQLTEDNYRDTRHFSNTLFNIMRGGIFDDGYRIEKWDFTDYLAQANKAVARSNQDAVISLPDEFSIFDLKATAEASTDVHFRRLCSEYLPLKFSRRHGDPSRPWNQFSINTRSEDGSKVLDYEGNWRDIFQNWEALARSYPEFIESIIHKFLNASTFDGYNPYRITKDGFEWETIEPDDPWSYIGYWGDHQIIYLLKLLEFFEDTSPGALEHLFDQEIFVYANVPYKIKSYSETLKNPKDTIEFDEDLDRKIRETREAEGADGALLRYESGAIVSANFIEKILVTILAKLSNFIPEAGIWMNTQRPEWNDANNALVGNGVSMVTLYYLRRFLSFFQAVFASVSEKEVAVSEELADFFTRVVDTLAAHKELLNGNITNQQRRGILDGLGQAGSDFRKQVYQQSFSGDKVTISLSELMSFCEVALQFLEHSIEANRRIDHLYHAYNLMTVEEDGGISVDYLDEMLEGQVAVLSAKYLTSIEALTVLDALKKSSLFREEQYSYMLYPNKELPSFMAKNSIPQQLVADSDLLRKLVGDNNTQIIKQDASGACHFNGNFRNANDLKQALSTLDEDYADLATQEKAQVLEIFEEVFNHKAFTGRSGTFYGYEGLGSIYWHMVSKLLLAVQQCCQRAVEEEESEEVVGRLLEHFYEITAGIGVHKPPLLYGAFPTDPYSHTPMGKGAQQPGMTGQVKEDVLSRFGELGIIVKNGQLHFKPFLLKEEEFLEASSSFKYFNIHSNQQQVQLEKNSLGFTYCQVPVVYKIADQESIEVHYQNSSFDNFNGLVLNKDISKKIFARTGEINNITVEVKRGNLR